MDSQLIFFYLIGISVTLSAGWISFQCPFLKVKRPFLYALIAGSLLFILAAQYLKYQTLSFYADFSHWDHLLYTIVHQGKPYSQSVEYLVPGCLNYLSVHFVPLIYLIAIPYKLFPHTETIIFCNVVIMFSSLIPLYKLSKRMRKESLFALLTSAILAWYLPFQYTVMYEFEMLRFAIPIILWLIYFYESEKKGWYFIFLILAILVREEVSLTMIMFGVYQAFIDRRKWTGFLTIVTGITAFLMITKVIMPGLMLESEGWHKYIATPLFASFGNSPSEIAKNVILHPRLVLETVFQVKKMANVFMYFLPFIFIPLSELPVLAITIANIGINLLSRSCTHTSYMLYYLSPSIPFIFYALIKGWPKCVSLCSRLLKKDPPFCSERLMAALLAATLTSNVFFGPSPISLQFWSKDLRPAPFRTHNYHYSVYRISKHHRLIDQFVDLIPDQAVVSAEQCLLPKLYQKKGTMIFPQLESVNKTVRADYCFIDKSNPVKTGVSIIEGSYDGLRENPQFYYDWVEKNPQQWRLVKSEDGYFLYERVRTGD